jgi:uncharacterized protein YqgV (UPF0045/DUF77 family)
VSNILIVESKNDKIFIQGLINYLNLNHDIEIDTPICIDDYECLEGLNESRLTNALKELAADIQKRKIQKVGIVIDIDNDSKQERLDFVNRCLQNTFPKAANLANTGEFITLTVTTDDGEEIQFQLACYFTNVEGKGELETVLKTIKTEDSPHADCLEAWKSCLENEGFEITAKDFDKFWISIYLRYDTCSNEERKQAGRKCSMSSFEYVMQEKRCIWNLDNPILKDLKGFLKLFS